MSLTKIDVSTAGVYYLEAGEVHGDIVSPIHGDLAIYTYAPAGGFLGQEYSFATTTGWFKRTQISEGSDGNASTAVVISDPIVTIDYNLNSTTEKYTLSGGVYKYITVAGPKNYRVYSTAQTYLKSSAASTLVGSHMTLNTDTMATTFTDFTAVTELSGLLSDNTKAASFEFWFKNDGLVKTANNNRLLNLGNNNTALLGLQIYPDTTFKVAIDLEQDTGASFYSSGNLDTGVVADTELHHGVFVLDRANDFCKLFLDGVEVINETATGIVAALPCTFNTTNMSLILGGTLTNLPNWDGYLYDFKIYQTALLVDDARNRTDRGPVQNSAALVSDSHTPVIWYDFVDGLWASSSSPEPVAGYGDVTTALTLNEGVGATTFIIDNNPELATVATSIFLVADTFTNVSISDNDTGISYYTKAGVTGELSFTEL